MLSTLNLAIKQIPKSVLKLQPILSKIEKQFYCQCRIDIELN